MPNKSCNTCGFASLNAQKCPVIGSPIDPSANYNCPYWCSDLLHCENCGQIIATNPIFTYSTIQEKYIVLCRDCQSKTNTCETCLEATKCDFETNPSPTPKAVQKTIKQGNFTSVGTVKNPERIRETCQVNCRCFDAENGVCNKENGCCGKYKEKF
jgi:hypothetical protein